MRPTNCSHFPSTFWIVVSRMTQIRLLAMKPNNRNAHVRYYLHVINHKDILLFLPQIDFCFSCNWHLPFLVSWCLRSAVRFTFRRFFFKIFLFSLQHFVWKSKKVYNFTNVATDNSIKTQSGKVYPSPGAARSVWALPLTASCNMVTDDNDHNHTEEETTPLEDKDTNLLNADLVVHIDDIFDVIKNG